MLREEYTRASWWLTRFDRASQQFRRVWRLKQQALATARPPGRSIVYRCFLPWPSFLGLQPELDQAGRKCSANSLGAQQQTRESRQGGLGNRRVKPLICREPQRWS